MKLKRTLISKIYTPSQATRLCKEARLSGKRVVFTNGCFDILHSGHVSYLETAKKKGDFLLVALNADSSVRKIKGLKRPINPLKDRMHVIAGLENVDAVTWFSESNPLALIKKLRPLVLVKGGDWKPSKIIGSKEVKSWKGKVFSIPFTKGKSTTRIIKKIRERT